jgi:hypothetical protein
MPTIKLPSTINPGHVASFVENVTQASLHERIVEALTVDIPLLWRREFRDATEDDLPKGLLDLAEELEHWCNVEFPEDEEESV